MYINLFDKIKKPLFLNESNNTKEEKEYLQSLLKNVSKEQKSKIENNIKNLEYALIGENKIIYELKNINEPIIVLQDIYLEEGDLSCQIDFIVFTRYNIFILESKNMYGNITITKEADFIRKNGNTKERISSPVTQVRRHKEMIIKLRTSFKKSIFSKNTVENILRERIIPLVVIANDKTIVDSKYAPKDIKDKIVNIDNLCRKMIQENQKVNDHIGEKMMIEIANFYLNLNKENPKRYFEKYKTSEKLICPKCGKDLVLRKSTKGNYIGQEFYGCSGYPKCNYIRNK